MDTPIVTFNLGDEELVDPEELVGDIQLSGSDRVIYAEAVYLDSWLLGLGQGLEEVKRGQPCKVELLEEAHPLRFQPSGSGFKLFFGDLSAHFPNTSEFEASLAVAAGEIVQRLAALNILRETDITRALVALSGREERKG